MSDSDKQAPTIVGTIISGETLRPFALDTAAKTIQLDVYEPAAAGKAMVTEATRIAEMVRKLLDDPVDAVRPGEYYCTACRTWFPADKNSWSITICLYCSLDRGTELAEHYEKLERSS